MVDHDPVDRYGSRGGLARDLGTVNKPKLYAGIAVSALGMLVMAGQSTVPWFFHIAVVLFVWGGVLIGMALRGQ